MAKHCLVCYDKTIFYVWTSSRYFYVDRLLRMNPQLGLNNKRHRLELRDKGMPVCFGCIGIGEKWIPVFDELPDIVRFRQKRIPVLYREVDFILAIRQANSLNELRKTRYKPCIQCMEFKSIPYNKRTCDDCREENKLAKLEVRKIGTPQWKIDKYNADKKARRKHYDKIVQKEFWSGKPKSAKAEYKFYQMIEDLPEFDLKAIIKNKRTQQKILTELYRDNQITKQKYDDEKNRIKTQQKICTDLMYWFRPALEIFDEPSNKIRDIVFGVGDYSNTTHYFYRKDIKKNWVKYYDNGYVTESVDLFFKPDNTPTPPPYMFNDFVRHPPIESWKCNWQHYLWSSGEILTKQESIDKKWLEAWSEWCNKLMLFNNKKKPYILFLHNKNGDFKPDILSEKILDKLHNYTIKIRNHYLKKKQPTLITSLYKRIPKIKDIQEEILNFCKHYLSKRVEYNDKIRFDKLTIKERKRIRHQDDDITNDVDEIEFDDDEFINYDYGYQYGKEDNWEE